MVAHGRVLAARAQGDHQRQEMLLPRMSEAGVGQVGPGGDPLRPPGRISVRDGGGQGVVP